MRPAWRLSAIVLFVLTLFAGGLLGDRLLALSGEARETLRLYTELVTAAHESFGGEVSYRELVDASIEGLIRNLDPHTSFLSEEAYDTMRDRQQSSFYGLGILVGMRNGQLTVITPIEGTPASRMGLRAGDVISAIEGEPTEGMNINEAVRRLKGPKGTEVSISVVRPGLQDPLELTIVRAEIPQNTVRYSFMIAPDTGYIAVSDFNRGTAREVAEAIDALRAQGMENLLLDLRNNGGGLLDQAIEVGEQFLAEGLKIVETRGRTRESRQDYYSRGRNVIPDLPLVILVNEGTASAAEILAGAVQDHDIGLIVGTPTWGKGLVQTVYSLSYGNGLALTTAKYYTPSGRLIQRDYSSWFDYQTLANGARSNGHAPLEPSDEDSESYLTDLGRPVYGGGGITPDVLVEPTETNAFLQYLLSRNVFFDFAVAYANSHEIPDPGWRPPAELLGSFRDWLVEKELTSAEEFDGELSEPTSRETVMRFLNAEIFNSAFGLDARFRVLAPGDPQIQKALGMFQEAGQLLAQRREREHGDEDSPPAAVGLLESRRSDT